MTLAGLLSVPTLKQILQAFIIKQFSPTMYSILDAPSCALNLLCMSRRYLISLVVRLTTVGCFEYTILSLCETITLQEEIYIKIYTEVSQVPILTTKMRGYAIH